MPSELTFLEGWHGLEYDNDAQPFRWMSTRANLTLEWSDDERPSLTIAAEVVSFGVTRQLVVESDGKVLAELTIPPHGLIDLVFDLPAGTGPIDLAFRVDPPAQAASIVTAHDRRRLAVAFWNVRIDAPYGAHLVRPA
jgi:hypothetical protein